MLGKTMLTPLFDYNADRNDRMLSLAANLSDDQLDAPTGYSMGSLRRTLWHIVIVEYGWRSRCQGIDARALPQPVEPTSSVEALREFAAEEATRAQAYLAEMSEDDLMTPFTARRGDQTFQLIPWQVLAHICHHSAQHRSEAAELLTRYGQSPGDIDFIFYLESLPRM